MTAGTPTLPGRDAPDSPPDGDAATPAAPPSGAPSPRDLGSTGRPRFQLRPRDPYRPRPSWPPRQDRAPRVEAEAPPAPFSYPPRARPEDAPSYPPSGAAHDEALRRQHEEQLSGRIQRTLLLGAPPAPRPDYEVRVLHRAAQSVGGDFFDFFQYGPGVHDLVLGDVMGKGFPAALVGAAIKARILRHSRGQRAGEEHRPEGTLPWILQRLHKDLVPDLQELGYFATMGYARFDLDRRRLTYVDCGHCPVFHLSRRTGAVSSLGKVPTPGANMPLGFPSEGRYEAVELEWDPGDVFLFTTDGLTEAMGGQSELRGRQALGELLAGLRDRSLDQLTAALEAWAGVAWGARGPADDATCLAVRVGEAEAGVSTAPPPSA